MVARGTGVRESAKCPGQLAQICARIPATGNRIETLTEGVDRRLSDEPDKVVSTPHPLVERWRAYADPVGDGLHRQAREPFGLQDVAAGSDDVIERGPIGRRHPYSLQIVPSPSHHNGY